MALKTATPKAPRVFENTTKLTTIHLGDGRKVAPGEKVEVTAELYALLAGK